MKPIYFSIIREYTNETIYTGTILGLAMDVLHDSELASFILEEPENLIISLAE